LAQNRLAALQPDAAPRAKSAGSPQVTLPQAPRSARPAVLSPDRDETTSMIERGRGLVAAGDIPAARIVLRRAYERGDERAALELGGTYDPRVLKRLNVTVNNFLADAAQARDWYVKAAELGSIDAVYRINELDLQNH